MVLDKPHREIGDKLLDSFKRNKQRGRVRVVSEKSRGVV